MLNLSSFRFPDRCHDESPSRRIHIRSVCSHRVVSPFPSTDLWVSRWSRGGLLQQYSDASILGPFDTPSDKKDRKCTQRRGIECSHGVSVMSSLCPGPVVYWIGLDVGSTREFGLLRWLDFFRFIAGSSIPGTEEGCDKTIRS